MSAQALTTEATKRCNACGDEVDRSGYSSKQWKARQMRRCMACTNAGREMRADDVPVPPSQEAAAAATADASVAEAAALLDAASINDPLAWVPASIRGLELPPLDTRLEREVFAPGSDKKQLALEIYRGDYAWIARDTDPWTGKGHDDAETLWFVCHEGNDVKAVVSVRVIKKKHLILGNHQAPPDLSPEELDNWINLSMASHCGPGARRPDDPLRLTSIQAELYTLRCLHHAFCDLSIHLSSDMTKHMVDYLRVRYAARKKAEGNLAHMAYYALARTPFVPWAENDLPPGHHAWASRICEFGEGLEVVSRFTDAAEVYIAGASTFGLTPGGPLEISTLWNNASLALKRAAKKSGDAALWARAEACLLNAVRVGGARYWCALELFWQNADAVGMVPRELPFIFGGLLGIVHHEDGDDERDLGRRNCRPTVRADMNRRRAEVILNNLSLCEDVEALRDAIRACRTRDPRTFYIPRGEELHRKPHKAAADDIRSRVPASDKTYVCEVCSLVSRVKLRAVHLQKGPVLLSRVPEGPLEDPPGGLHGAGVAIGLSV